MFRKSNELNILYGGRRLATKEIFSDDPDTPTSGESLPKNAVFTDVLIQTGGEAEIRIHLYKESADIWVQVAHNDNIDSNGYRFTIPTRGYDRLCMEVDLAVEGLDAFMAYPRLEG